MIPKFSEEIWLSRFAKHLQRVQPGFSPLIAREVALHVYSKLMMLKPEDAVQTFLVSMKDMRFTNRE